MMYSIRNNGAARDFDLNGHRHFMGRSVVKRTNDRDFAKAMNSQLHVTVQGLDSIDDMKMGELRQHAKSCGVVLKRGDKKLDIIAKINAAESQ